MLLATDMRLFIAKVIIFFAVRLPRVRKNAELAFSFPEIIIHIVEAGKWTERCKIRWPDLNQIPYLLLNSNGSILLGVEDFSNGFYVWNAINGEMICEHQYREKPTITLYDHVKLTRNGRFAVFANDHRAQALVWDIKKGKEIARVETKVARIPTNGLFLIGDETKVGVISTSDGKNSGSESYKVGKVSIVDLQSGKTAGNWSYTSNTDNDPVFTARGFLGLLGRNPPHFFEMLTGSEITLAKSTRMGGHIRLSFSDDGWLVSGNQDLRSIRVWELWSRLPILDISTPDLSSHLFAPGGEKLLVALKVHDAYLVQLQKNLDTQHAINRSELWEEMLSSDTLTARSALAHLANDPDCVNFVTEKLFSSIGQQNQEGPMNLIPERTILLGLRTTELLYRIGNPQAVNSLQRISKLNDRYLFSRSALIMSKLIQINDE